jgi:phosphoglycolate phosphatase
MSGRSSGVAARFAAVFYDLDGTLVDSRPGIEASLRVAFAAHLPGVAPPPLDTLLGQPLPGLLRGALPAGLDRAALPAVAATFTQHYDTEGWRLSRPYAGVSAVLRDLARAGVRQFVVTNKRARPTAAILAACDLASLIERVYTLDSTDPPYADKRAMAQAAQAACAVPGERLLVVGDSTDDRHMAEACGAAFAAAAYGYGDAAATIGSRPGAEAGAAVPARFVLDAVTRIVGLVVPADPWTSR